MAERSTVPRLDRSFDVVVIGAGNGGLAAGAQLAVKGARVLVLEQHNLPGGFASSFVRGRFEFEPSLHELCDVGPPDNKGSVREFLEDDLGVEVDFVSVPEAFRLILTDDGLDVRMPFGLDAYIDAIDREVPGSRDVVRKFMDLSRESLDALGYIAEAQGNPDRKVLAKQFTNFLKTAPYSADAVADAVGVSEDAKKLLFPYWCYLGLPVSRINFTLFGAMLHKYITKGAYIPRHRSHELTTALDARIRECGGCIEYNTRVEQILVERGRVVGIKTARGDTIATNRVIANTSPTTVYNMMIHPRDEVPAIAYKYVNARIHGVSSFVVYLGLDASPDELGLDDYGYFIFPHMNTDALYESLQRLDVPIANAAICLNRAIPNCSPPGTTILSMTTLYRPEAWEGVRPEEYFALKSRLADGFIAMFEEATHTRVRDHIEEIEVATPETFARYTRTYKGIIYGYEPESWDGLMARLMSLKEDRFIEGLEFAGGFASRAHGYSSAILSGQTAALLTMKAIREKAEVAS